MDITMSYELAEIVMPTMLIVLAFVLKLFINRNVTKIIICNCLLELPMDMIFLSMGYIISFTLSKQENFTLGLVVFGVGIIFACLIFAFCRYSLTLFETNGSSKLSLLIFAASSHILALCTYVFSVTLLLGGPKA